MNKIRDDVDQWAAYIAEPTDARRNALVEKYLPLVKPYAASLRAKLPWSIDFDDLVSWGTMGLISAVEAYRLDGGSQFKTFAARRIVGAMLDELRNLDPLSRSSRAQYTEFERLRDNASKLLGRPANEHEIAELSGLTEQQVSELVQLGHGQPASLHLVYQATGMPDVFLHALLRDRKADDPARNVDRRAIVQELLKGMTKLERVIMVLLYVEQLTVADVSRTVKLSASRISQLHGDLVRRLRAKWTDRRDELIEIITA